MKRLSQISGLLIVTGLFSGLAVAQDSLADAARQQKKQKQAKVTAVRDVFTNDKLPREGVISTVGAHVSESDAVTPDSAQAQAPDAAAGANGDASDASGKPADAKPVDDAQKRQKGWEEWRDKIEKQKSSVEQMQKDNEQAETDFRVRANTFYSSPLSRVNNGVAEAKGEATAKDQIALQKKSLDDAKQKLEDMQEEARRAGVPSGFRD